MDNGNLKRTEAYLRAIETGSGAQLDELAHPTATFQQLPNVIYPRGMTVTLAEAKANFERGRQLLSSQHYRIVSSMSVGERVAVEIEWTGILAVPMKTLAAGDPMVAYCAMFIDWREGRIVAQRNYDCYMPF